MYRVLARRACEAHEVMDRAVACLVALLVWLAALPLIELPLSAHCRCTGIGTLLLEGCALYGVLTAGRWQATTAHQLAISSSTQADSYVIVVSMAWHPPFASLTAQDWLGADVWCTP